jgi:hypothetical protein
MSRAEILPLQTSVSLTGEFNDIVNSEELNETRDVIIGFKSI